MSRVRRLWIRSVALNGRFMTLYLTLICVAMALIPLVEYLVLRLSPH